MTSRLTRANLKGKDRKVLYQLAESNLGIPTYEEIAQWVGGMTGEDVRHILKIKGGRINEIRQARRILLGARPLAGRVTGGFLSKVVFDHDCWIWTGKHEIKFDGRVTKIRSLAYDLAFPETEWYPGRKLTNTCNNQDCFNPDHLTDPFWGFWDDLDTMTSVRTTPGEIAARMGMTIQEVMYRAKDSRHPRHITIRARLQRLVLDELEALSDPTDWNSQGNINSLRRAVQQAQLHLAA